MYRLLLLGLIGVVVLAVMDLSRAADPSALWHIIDGRCVPNQERLQDPAPCTKVDLSQGRARGYVVLKDMIGVSQFLVMPTARIHGVESAEILAADAPNYWQPAWEARRYMEERLHDRLAREDVALAINSSVGRSQDQLHIHVDCVRADVKAALAELAPAIGTTWAKLPMRLAGHAYRAMRLEQPSLANANPFHLLADSDPAVAADMAYYTLVVIGATFGGHVPGFVLLADRADLAAGDHGAGEELQDHGCAVAKAG